MYSTYCASCSREHRRCLHRGVQFMSSLLLRCVFTRGRPALNKTLRLQLAKQTLHSHNHRSPASLTFFSFLSASVFWCLCHAASSKPTSLCNSVQWDLIRAMQQSDCRQATNLSVMILRQLRFHSFDKERSFSRNRREIGVLLAMSVLTASSAISSE